MMRRLLALFALLGGLAALTAPAGAAPMPQPSCQSAVSVRAIGGEQQRADGQAWTRERAFTPARIRKTAFVLDRVALSRAGVLIKADRALE